MKIHLVLPVGRRREVIVHRAWQGLHDRAVVTGVEVSLVAAVQYVDDPWLSRSDQEVGMYRTLAGVPYADSLTALAWVVS